MALWYDFEAAARHKFKVGPEHMLTAVNVHCGCCELPDWCVATIEVAIKKIGPRGGVKWLNIRKGFLSRETVEAFEGKGEPPQKQAGAESFEGMDPEG